MAILLLIFSGQTLLQKHGLILLSTYHVLDLYGKKPCCVMAIRSVLMILPINVFAKSPPTLATMALFVLTVKVRLKIAQKIRHKSRQR